MTSRDLLIRPADETDAPAIRGLVSAAHLNPRDLDGRRFLVADAVGEIVACPPGFHAIEGDQVPRDMRWRLRMAGVAIGIRSLVARQAYRIVAMRRLDPLSPCRAGATATCRWITDRRT